MALDPEELGGWIARLTADPLDPFGETKDLYQKLEHAGRDPVDAVCGDIRLALRRRPTTQLLSGPPGSGKTTELLRLKGTLEGYGYTVVLVDMLEYVSQSAPVDITDVLIAIALGCSEQLAPRVADEGAAKRFRDRVWSLVQRVHVTADVAGVQGEVSADRIAASMFGVGVELDLKAELKSSPPFIEELRRRLAPQIGQLYQEVAEFLQGLVRRHGSASSARAASSSSPTAWRRYAERRPTTATCRSRSNGSSSTTVNGCGSPATTRSTPSRRRWRSPTPAC